MGLVHPCYLARLHLSHTLPSKEDEAGIVGCVVSHSLQAHSSFRALGQVSRMPTIRVNLWHVSAPAPGANVHPSLNRWVWYPRDHLRFTDKKTGLRGPNQEKI